jgi:hypothetical protein
MDKTALALLMFSLAACASNTAEVTVVPITPTTPTAEATPAPSATANAVSAEEAAKLAAELDRESAAVQGVLDKSATPVGGGLSAPGSGTPPNVGGPTVRLLPAKSTAEISDLASVVTGLRSGFVRCFSSALKRDPRMTGAFVLEAKVNDKGEVVGVKANEVRGLPADVVGCINQVMRGARFKPPQGGSAVITLPINVSPQ